MEFLSKYSVRGKIMVVLSAIVSLAVIASSLIFYGQVVSAYNDSYRHELGLRATIVGANSTAALAFSLPDDAHAVLATLQVDPSIVAARIRNRDGRLFACYGQGCQEDFIPGQEALAVSEKIVLDGHVIGEMELVDDIRHIRAFRDKAMLNLGLILTGVLICCAFLARRLSFFITSPLQELAALAGTIAREENYQLRATAHGQDEVGTMAEAFNAMLARIDEKTRDLIASERRFRTLVDQGVDAFFLLDGEGRFLDVNQMACDSLGYTREELLTLTVADVDGESVSRRDREQFWAKLVPGEAITLTSHHKRRDGALFPVEVRLGVLEMEGRRCIMGLARDITARIRAEEEQAELEARLLQSQKMEAIGTLAGGIAHDFNNILSVIFGYTELAMMEEDPRERGQDLEQIKLGAERAKELVKQILAFSRRQGEQERQPLQVSLIVKEALKMLRSSIPTTIEIRQEIAAPGTVLADPTQIHQIIMNLCTNAYHAMREKGGILAVVLGEMEIRDIDEGYGELPPGRYLKLEVSDTGSGIRPEILDKIFEPYFTTKKTGEGTGLGLAVVHGIVKSHHGYITVYSEAGRGTTFHVYLPLLEEPAAERPAQEEHAGCSGQGERILFVDDELQIREFALRLFSLYGYRVTTATNGVEALATFANHPEQFDLLITDMTMPYMTGAELAQKILGLRPELPIILCTGQSELVNREKALAMGICEYLNKPVVKHDFLSAIRKALTKKV